MVKYPGLVRRGNKCYIRKRVPTDIAHLYNSNSLKRSLGTEDQATAKKLYHKKMLQLESEFDQTRMEALKSKDADQLSGYSEAALLGLAYSWYDETRHKNKKSGQKHAPEELMERHKESLYEKQQYLNAIQSQDYEIIYPHVKNG